MMWASLWSAGVSWSQLSPHPSCLSPAYWSFAGVVWEENLGARIAPQQWPKQCRVTSTGFVTNAKHGFNDTSSIPVWQQGKTIRSFCLSYTPLPPDSLSRMGSLIHPKIRTSGENCRRNCMDSCIMNTFQKRRNRGDWYTSANKEF